MKVLLDLKPLQGECAHYDIGKVTFELSKCLVKKLEKPWILLSNLNPKKGVQIRKDFRALNPGVQFEVLVLDGFKTYFELYKRYKTKEAFLPYELLLEWKVSQISPEAFLIFSFFDRDHPTSLGKLEKKWLNLIVVHDLDLIFTLYKNCNKEEINAWYNYKLEEFKKADFYFVTSVKVKRELIEKLSIPEEKIKEIPLGNDKKLWDSATEIILETVSKKKHAK